MERYIQDINAGGPEVMLNSDEAGKLVDELLAVLDEDVRLLEKTLIPLDELRGFVIKRDESSLRTLLEKIETERNAYGANEQKRRQIRQELARLLGCPAEAMNLSKLERDAPAEKQTAVSERKTKLKGLTEKLRTEHFSTVMLLSECARLNRLLLRSVFGFSGRGVIYGADGNTKWNADRSIVSAKV